MIIDRKIEGILTGIILIYFLNISLYSIIPDIIDIPIIYQRVFYWCNHAITFSVFTFIFSKFVVNKRIKILIKGTSLFLIILGTFQVLISLGKIFELWVWAIFCPCYVIFLLITYKLCQQRDI